MGASRKLRCRRRGVATYLRVGSKIINTDNFVDADVTEPGEEKASHYDGQVEEHAVVITTTAVESRDGGTLAPYKIVLEGEDAAAFPAALAVYTPVLEKS